MRRRLLQRLQQAVEGLVGQHVDLVDDVDLVARRHRRIAHLLDDLADVVDAGVGGRVHLDHVDVAALHDGAAVLALFLQLDGRPVDFRRLVVERARQDARRRGLADTAHARQHPRLGDAPGGEGVGQRAHHRLLADEGGKVLRPVFARKHTIGGGLARTLLAGFAHPSVLLQIGGRPGRPSPAVSPSAGRGVNACDCFGRRMTERREAGTMTRAVAR